MSKRTTKTKAREDYWPDPASPFAEDQAKAPRKTDADLEKIKLEAIKEIVHRMECIQGEGDPEELRDTNGDDVTVDLPMLAQHASDLSEAYFVWEAANSALISRQMAALKRPVRKVKAKRASAEIGAAA